VRISTTTLESFRLFMEPDQEWMTEKTLIDTIRGEFVPNRGVLLGSGVRQGARGSRPYLVPGGYHVNHGFSFSEATMAPALAIIDRRGIFEAKREAAYGAVDVVAKADHILGAHLSEFKTTARRSTSTSTPSCQWRFMVDIFEPLKVTYHVFLLDDHENGVAELKGIETFNLYPYAGCTRTAATCSAGSSTT
jgi:hypothetical protein